MDTLQVFKHEMFGAIRTIAIGEKVLFCGNDVARALGYKDTVNALKTHCKEDGVVEKLRNEGHRERSTIFYQQIYRKRGSLNVYILRRMQ